MQSPNTGRLKPELQKDYMSKQQRNNMDMIAVS